MKQISHTFGLCVLATAALLLAPLTHATKTHSHLHVQHQKTVKPGAAVQMQHNYDGKTAVNEIETIELQFKHSYSSGELHIQFFSQAGLDIISGNQQLSLNAESAQAVVHELAVSAATDGRYRLYASVEAVDELGNSQSRSFGIELQVGEPVQLKAAAPGFITMPNGDKIIQMPAQQP